MLKNWYLVYTNTGCEIKISKVLNKIKIVNFYPLNRIKKGSGYTSKIISQPLFPNYIFVYTTEVDLKKIVKINGIINIVYWLSSPVIFKIDEITTLKKFSEDYENIIVEKCSVNAYDTFKLVKNPAISRGGEMLLIRNNNVKLILPGLGYIISVDNAQGFFEIEPQTINANNFAF